MEWNQSPQEGAVDCFEQAFKELERSHTFRTGCGRNVVMGDILHANNITCIRPIRNPGVTPGFSKGPYRDNLKILSQLEQH